MNDDVTIITNFPELKESLFPILLKEKNKNKLINFYKYFFSTNEENEENEKNKDIKNE